MATEFNAVNSLELICRAHQLVQVRCRAAACQPLPAPAWTAGQAGWRSCLLPLQLQLCRPLLATTRCARLCCSAPTPP